MDNSDNVSRIHGMYSVTLLTPASKIHSLIYSLLTTVAFVILSVLIFVPRQEIAGILALALVVMAATQALDSRLIRNKHYAKALHMSLYSNLLWILMLLVALVSITILPDVALPASHIGVGMFAIAGFRIGLMTSVLGVDIKRAWGISLIQPVAIFLVLVPPEMWLSTLTHPTTLGLGLGLMALATAWSLLTDRAGRPRMGSTHRLIQAYLYSKEDMVGIESMLEEHSKPSKISTSQLRFKADKEARDVRLVLPEIHPGPFHPIGGSNVPFQIYQTLDSSAMVMHTISDHAMNLPSSKQVRNYLESLSGTSLADAGMSCTEPATVQINKARVIGLRFDKSVLLFLSLSPYGMEDLPIYVKKAIEGYSQSRNYERSLIIDCHNAMGREISGDDSADMLKAARLCLDSLMTKKDHPFKFGYANSTDMDIKAPDLALGGLAVLCLDIGEKRYFVGWADANNMENGVRESVVESLTKQGYHMLEISTSDTHFAQSQVRTKQGYYQFGAITPEAQISEWYLRLSEKASGEMTPGSFEILENQADLKVMGPMVFEDFNRALDNSFKLSKIFMTAGVATFLLSLFL